MIQSVDFNEASYDEFMAFVEERRENYRPRGVIARSQEDAQAFAVWCVENDIEEPKILVLES